MSNPVVSQLPALLAAIANPLRFVARDNYRRLERVQDLESTLARAAERAQAGVSDAAIQRQLKSFVDALPQADQPIEVRVAALRACEAMLDTLTSAPESRHSRPETAPAPLPESAGSASPGSKSLAPDQPIQFVKGVGPRIGQALAIRNIETVADLLRFLPRRYEDRRTGRSLSELDESVTAMVEGEILSVSHRRFRGRSTLDVVIGDGTGRLTLKWFRVPGRGYAERFVKGMRLRASGAVKRYRGGLQIVHPETLLDPAESLDDVGDNALVPVYLEVEGLRPVQVRKLIERALPVVAQLPEVLPAYLRELHGLPDLATSIHALHVPPTTTSAEELTQMTTPWHRRLIYEELLLLQLVVLQRKARASSEEGIAIGLQDNLERTAGELFRFELTGAQKRVIQEVDRDVRLPMPMNRLLQGDVGSGKTAVAFAAAVGVARAGYQVAIMAPTEILAEQHARVALKLLTPVGVRVALLTGTLRAAERRQVLDGLATGNIHVVVGTHALIQQDVAFKALGLGIVDEQHRFGVMQRARFVEQGQASTGRVPHMFVMTATPIPRTLALTVYGDLDVSVMDELPPGRTPIRTRRFTEKNRSQVYGLVRQAVEAGRQAYVVLPLVEESDKEGMDTLRDATTTAEELRGGELAGISVGLLHGKMTADDKDRVMRGFARGDVQVLVATTVIEVGIDVANATVMVIEHAERFGLSQLHQLRGRVGRGQHASDCYLVARYTPSEDAWRRLAVMEESTDGFRIAEEDLEIRGPGDFVGTRQSGLPLLSIANLARDQDLLHAARGDAAALLERDPNMSMPEHAGLRQLLEVSWEGRFALAQIG